MKVILMFTAKVLIFCLVVLGNSQSCIKCYKNTLDQCQLSSDQIISNYLTFSFEISSLHNNFYDIAYNQKSIELHQDIEQEQTNMYSIADIYSLIFDSLIKSKKNRQKNGDAIQSSRRSFTISEVFHFKKWFIDQSQPNKILFQQFLQNQYIQILGGQEINYHPQTYYKDIISLYQDGLMFLRQKLNYVPKAVITKSIQKTNLMLLKLLGFQMILGVGLDIFNSNQQLIKGSFYLRMLKDYNQIQSQYEVTIFIQKVVSSFNFDLKQDKCQSLYDQIEQFQSKFVDQSKYRMVFMNISKYKPSNSYFSSVQKIMDQFGRQKCKKGILGYGNFKYFSQTLRFQKFNKFNQDQLVQRGQNRFSSIHFFGRKFSSHIRNIQNLLFLQYLTNPRSLDHKNQISILKNMKEIQALLLKAHTQQKEGQSQHILGRMKQSLQVSGKIISRIYQKYFPLQSTNPILLCRVGICQIPKTNFSNILIKIISFQTHQNQQKIQIKLPKGEFYSPYHENITYFYQYDRENQNCVLLIYKKFYTYTMIHLKKVDISKINEKISYYRVIRQDQNIRHYRNSCQLNLKNRKIQINIRRNASNIYQFYSLKKIMRYTNPLTKKYRLQWSEGFTSQMEINKNKTDSIEFNFPMSDKQNQVVFQTQIKNNKPLSQKHFFLTDSNGLLQKKQGLSKQWVNFNRYIKLFGLDGNHTVSFFTDNGYTAGRVQKQNIAQIKVPLLLDSDFGSNFKLAIAVSQNFNSDQHYLFQSQKMFQINAVQQSKRISYFHPNWKAIFKWQQIVKNYQNIKFFLKIQNQSSGIITLINQQKKQMQINLFADNVIPILTLFYGQIIKTASIQEVTIGANMKYTDFIQSKSSFKQQDQFKNNQFFQSTFRQQIIMKPLSIRSFRLTNLTISSQCQEKINFTKKFTNYKSKQPIQKQSKQNYQSWEDIMKDFLINGNHCTEQSPVTKAFQFKKREPPRKQIASAQNKNIKMKQKTVKSEQVNNQSKKQNGKNKLQFLTKQQEASLNEKGKQKKQQQNNSDKYFKVDQDKFSSIREKIMRRQKIQRKQKYIYFKQKMFRIKNKKTLTF